MESNRAAPHNLNMLSANLDPSNPNGRELVMRIRRLNLVHFPKADRLLERPTHQIILGI